MLFSLISYKDSMDLGYFIAGNSLLDWTRGVSESESKLGLHHQRQNSSTVQAFVENDDNLCCLSMDWKSIVVCFALAS